MAKPVASRISLKEVFISAYQSISKMNDDLMDKNNQLKGSLIDNYVLTYYSDFVEKNDVRIETTFPHAITYGLSLRANASSKMLKCFRRYVRNHPQEAFEIIAKYLKPLKVRKLMESRVRRDKNKSKKFLRAIVYCVPRKEESRLFESSCGKCRGI